MTKKLEILKESLKKKQERFDDKLQEHFDTVAQANGQPLNDKRNGVATLSKWEKQNESLRALKEEIEKTERAIEREEWLIKDCENATIILPNPIVELMESGVLNQWRKHPNTFFVAGVDKGRIIWDTKKNVVAHRYYGSIPDNEQKKIFAGIYNELYKKINEVNHD